MASLTNRPQTTYNIARYYSQKAYANSASNPSSSAYNSTQKAQNSLSAVSSSALPSSKVYNITQKAQSSGSALSASGSNRQVAPSGSGITVLGNGGTKTDLSAQSTSANGANSAYNFLTGNSNGTNLSDLDSYISLANSYDNESRTWSASEAQKARDWATEMSNTAHQREVKDLIAAGLNPVLSAGSSGAPSYSAVSASGDYNNTSSMISGIVGSAVQAATAQTQRQTALDQIHSNEELAYITGRFNTTVAGIYTSGTITAANIAAAQNEYSTNVRAVVDKYVSDNARDASIYGTNQSTSVKILENGLDLYKEIYFPKTEFGLYNRVMNEAIGLVRSSIGQKPLIDDLSKCIGFINLQLK